MKLLKVDKNFGFFLDIQGNFVEIDKITKEDLLRLANLTLGEADVELDPYDEQTVKHLAHQVIYKNVADKLGTLKGQRTQFVDESERLYLVDYEKYKKGMAV
jgi:hypothetical protein